MILKILMTVFILSLISCVNKKSTSINNSQYSSLVDLVNPLMGTDSKFSLSNGNTYPAIAKPWGMNFWTPQTAKMGDGWAYKYDDEKIRGIKQTHQPSPWLNDYASFSLMAFTGKLKYKEDERASWFSHKAEDAKPYHYKVYLADYDISAEVTPTERAAMFRFTFPKIDSSYILIDAFNKGSMVKIIPEQRKIIGYVRNNNGGVPENFHNYFVAVFDKDFKWKHTWNDNWKLNQNNLESQGDHVGAIIGFKTELGEQVNVKVASSFISLEQAEHNMEQEIGKKNFEELKRETKASWESEFQKLVVEDANIDNIRTFYSCLYRLLLFPRKFYEIDKLGNIVHYSPYNGQVLPGYMFTDNGFWDTFRAVFPFFNLMYPDLNKKIMEGLANTYKESGWLPEWSSPGHRDVMIGSNSASIIADAYLKGNMNKKDEKTLLEAVLKNADINKGRPVKSVGREGVDYYNTLGYVPYDVGINENAARTLEYAYADFTIAVMAEKMNKPKISRRFYNQSKNYINLFDESSKLMRGKNKDGTFQSPFNPLKWGDAFTEGNSLHYSWSVFHDIQGLIDLMGGDSEFINMLDSVFTMPPKFDDSYYGFTIHEIREMQIVNMGNYAHGNQPIQHMIYLYNYAKQPWKAQNKVRNVMKKLYSAEPDGYCGDEDNGQTSAWYVFSALGFYPVTPGVPQYVLGSPLFDKVTMSLHNGKKFTIKSDDNNYNSHYIKSLKLNGADYNNTWIGYDEIKKGGNLIFKMDNKPNKDFGVSNLSRPFSLSNK
ncbi:MAG: alpha-mannosidase [Flavobacteriales bacterium]|nr:alpha-mannosidase [Flavobacteriales bacterium]